MAEVASGLDAPALGDDADPGSGADAASDLASETRDEATDGGTDGSPAVVPIGVGEDAGASGAMDLSVVDGAAEDAESRDLSGLAADAPVEVHSGDGSDARLDVASEALPDVVPEAAPDVAPGGGSDVAVDSAAP